MKSNTDGVVEPQGTWFDFFPFANDSFRDVIYGDVSWEFVQDVSVVLRQILDDMIVRQQKYYGSDVMFNLFSNCLVAYHRIEIINEYERDIRACSGLEFDDLLASVQESWDYSYSLQRFPVECYDNSTCEFLSSALNELVSCKLAPSGMTIENTTRLHKLLRHSTAVRVRDYYVWSGFGVGVPLRLCGLDSEVRLLSRSAYSAILQCMLTPLYGPGDEPLFVWDSDDSTVSDVSEATVLPTCAASTFDDASSVTGQCYLRLYAPCHWDNLLAAHGKYPTLRALLTSPGAFMLSGEPAKCRLNGEVLHVLSAGSLPDEYSSMGSYRIGGYDDTQPDLFARALIDGMIARRRVVDEVTTAPQSEAGTDTSSGGFTLVDIARSLHEAVDQHLSPSAQTKPPLSVLSSVGGDDGRALAGGSRARILRDRLSFGPVLDDSPLSDSGGWFQRTVLRRRSGVSFSGGRAFHLFDACDYSNISMGACWRLDKTFRVEGWRSYTAALYQDTASDVEFRLEGHTGDVRMDCYGVGVIDFGVCETEIAGSVVWFTTAMRCKITCRAEVLLRVSVPDAGFARPIPPDLHHCLRIPGFTLALVNFGVVSRTDTHDVQMKLGRRSVSRGVQIYKASYKVAAGKRVVRLRGMIAGAPVRLIVATDHVRDLEYVEWCGVRMFAVRRDYVTFCVDTGHAEFALRLKRTASVRFSAMQIVDSECFDNYYRSDG